MKKTNVPDSVAEKAIKMRQKSNQNKMAELICQFMKLTDFLYLSGKIDLSQAVQQRLTIYNQVINNAISEQQLVEQMNLFSEENRGDVSVLEDEKDEGEFFIGLKIGKILKP